MDRSRRSALVVFRDREDVDLTEAGRGRLALNESRGNWLEPVVEAHDPLGLVERGRFLAAALTVLTPQGGGELSRRSANY